jgi:hydroxymethylpyrimidine/phosphomethylpyrimidine kinase
VNSPPVALTIAGSDSGGGAGVQADLTTFAAHGVHGASAVTAVTVQDTTGVHGIHLVPSDVVLAQIRAVLTDLRPAAVKTGMLGGAATTNAVAALAGDGLLPCLVVDPVLVSTSGHSLAGDGVTVAMREHLLPHATVVTPNTDEAAALLGAAPAASLREQVDQARALVDLGCRTVVVTGGSFERPGGAGGPVRVDVVATPEGARTFTSPEVATTNDHGTGCTFASAIAAGLAHGQPASAAVETARAFVRTALLDAAAWRIGSGRGPVSHVHPDLRTRTETATQTPTQTVTQTQTRPPRGENP